MTNTGSSQIVAGPNGQRLRPYYVRRRGHLACGHHALLPVLPGAWIIQAGQHRGDFEIEVGRVPLDFDPKSVQWHEYGEDAVSWLVLSEVYTFRRGEWDREPPAFLAEAVEAAKKKATQYHCRVPVFVAEA